MMDRVYVRYEGRDRDGSIEDRVCGLPEFLGMFARELTAGAILELLVRKGLVTREELNGLLPGSSPQVEKMCDDCGDAYLS